MRFVIYMHCFNGLLSVHAFAGKKVKIDSLD